MCNNGFQTEDIRHSMGMCKMKLLEDLRLQLDYLLFFRPQISSGAVWEKQAGLSFKLI